MPFGNGPGPKPGPQIGPRMFAENHRGEGTDILATIFTFVVAVLIILAVVWLIRMLINARRTGPASPAGRSAALGELDLRYARGEVDHTDYLERRANLLGGPSAPPAIAAAPSPTPPAKRGAPPTT